MRIVVTGGAGYIGSVVVEVLIDQGHDVLVLDNLSKGHRDAVESARFVQVDLADQGAVTAYLLEFGGEVVVHMAADSLVAESMANPARYYRNNLAAGLSLLEAMRAARVYRLVFSSTAAVYGEPARQPIEETEPTEPTHPYGDSKLAFERALRWYATAYGLSSASLRCFNAAGATARNGERHEPETHLVPQILRVAGGRLPHLTVFGDDYPTPDGTCIRDYVHVSDLADAHVLALDAIAERGTCRTYNVGCGGKGYSVREVLEVAERVTGCRIPARIATRRAGDPAILVASTGRITRELGWQPRYRDIAGIIGSAWTWMQRRGSGGCD